MRRRYRWMRGVAVALLLAFVAILAGLAIACALMPSGVTISIDDAVIDLSSVGVWDAAPTLALVAMLMLIVLVIGAFAVVLALLLAALSVLVALCTVVVTLALLTSPLLFVVWLLWKASRRRTAPGAATA